MSAPMVIPAVQLAPEHIGRTVRLSGDPETYQLVEIVGVLAENGLDDPDRLEVFVENRRTGKTERLLVVPTMNVITESAPQLNTPAHEAAWLMVGYCTLRFVGDVLRGVYRLNR